MKPFKKFTMFDEPKPTIATDHTTLNNVTNMTEPIYGPSILIKLLPIAEAIQKHYER